jgi:hypothetical protein
LELPDQHSYKENPRQHYVLGLLSCVFAFGGLNSRPIQGLLGKTVSGNPALYIEFLSSLLRPGIAVFSLGLLTSAAAFLTVGWD